MCQFQLALVCLQSLTFMANVQNTQVLYRKLTLKHFYLDADDFKLAMANYPSNPSI